MISAIPGSDNKVRGPRSDYKVHGPWCDCKVKCPRSIFYRGDSKAQWAFLTHVVLPIHAFELCLTRQTNLICFFRMDLQFAWRGARTYYLLKAKIYVLIGSKLASTCSGLMFKDGLTFQDMYCVCAIHARTLLKPCVRTQHLQGHVHCARTRVFM